MKALSLAACLVVLALPAYAQSLGEDGDTENMIIGQAAENYKVCLTGVIREQALQSCERDTTIYETAIASCKASETTLMTIIATVKDSASVERAQQMMRISQRPLIRLVNDIRKKAGKSCAVKDGIKPIF
jgi:hypothetical protein